MKERPILFSAPMVRAILAGTKTQTRRVVKYNLDDGHDRCHHPYRWFDAAAGKNEWACAHCGHALGFRCPYGQPGDRLWVRETWAHDGPDLETVRSRHEDAMAGIGYGPYYRADKIHENTGLTWRPSIHMPRWASRITLEIIGVRVEKLGEISYEDALAEGVTDMRPMIADECNEGETADQCARRLHWPQRSYELLWNKINGPGSWALNPWVWVLEFKKS